ncbi:MAG TPA: tRNA (guanosine(46)-N7)-methyltransferase TrmB [bacterium]|nr:tRNA (guanosine(46)-N7)-methyltransferase TrmB [bacterium]
MDADTPIPPPRTFGTVPDLALQRQFPTAHRERKPFEFYPALPATVTGDLLEIGPGRGDFLLAEAAAHPERRFVAIEIGRKRHLRLIRRIERRELCNVLLICGDARLVIPRHLPDRSFPAVVVLFPDPWPKRRHAFHRLLQPDFLRELARVLTPGGHMYLKSDVAEYVEWVARQVVGISEFRIVDDRWPWGPVRGQDGKTLSLFAERQSALGYGIHSLCLERVPSGAAPERS